MAKALVYYPDKCTACRDCEIACSFKYHGEFNPAKSRINVSIFLEDAFYLPAACYQCDNPGCATVCPTGALHLPKNENGVVQYNPNKCIGCRMCTLGCPFGVIHYLADTGKVQKCDLCEGDPECVKFCVPGAIVYKETAEGLSAKRKAYAREVQKSQEGE